MLLTDKFRDQALGRDKNSAPEEGRKIEDNAPATSPEEQATTEITEPSPEKSDNAELAQNRDEFLKGQLNLYCRKTAELLEHEGIFPGEENEKVLQSINAISAAVEKGNTAEAMKLAAKTADRIDNVFAQQENKAAEKIYAGTPQDLREKHGLDSSEKLLEELRADPGLQEKLSENETVKAAIKNSGLYRLALRRQAHGSLMGVASVPAAQSGYEIPDNTEAFRACALAQGYPLEKLAKSDYSANVWRDANMTLDGFYENLLGLAALPFYGVDAINWVMKKIGLGSDNPAGNHDQIEKWLKDKYESYYKLFGEDGSPVPVTDRDRKFHTGGGIAADALTVFGPGALVGTGKMATALTRLQQLARSKPVMAAVSTTATTMKVSGKALNKTKKVTDKVVPKSVKKGVKLAGTGAAVYGANELTDGKLGDAAGDFAKDKVGDLVDGITKYFSDKLGLPDWSNNIFKGGLIFSAIALPSMMMMRGGGLMMSMARTAMTVLAGVVSFNFVTDDKKAEARENVEDKNENPEQSEFNENAAGKEAEDKKKKQVESKLKQKKTQVKNELALE
jgi:hypothetical protein